MNITSNWGSDGLSHRPGGHGRLRLVNGSTPAGDALRVAREHAAAAGATDVVLAAEQGDPVDVLISLAGRHHTDLLVVGNRGLNSLAGRLLGSVPSAVTHRAACDVLIAHTTSGGRH
ncbi:universal stress protein [Nonomuraea sp. NPDC048916]|uniref:universal stress protein n=1 Tax=Nonomuraea sp. NPDC048916 TaxID=3154232 RepID=UPI0033C66E0B